MTEYEIKRWDVLLINNKRVPAIYIEPDLDFINFIREHNYNVISIINGTGMAYDNQEITGSVNQSSYYPNCRPNFYSKTGLYVITLGSCWLGYPSYDKLGKVKFFAYN
jgi:hypothetical protein